MIVNLDDLPETGPRTERDGDQHSVSRTFSELTKLTFRLAIWPGEMRALPCARSWNFNRACRSILRAQGSSRLGSSRTLIGRRGKSNEVIWRRRKEWPSCFPDDGVVAYLWWPMLSKGEKWLRFSLTDMLC